MSTNSAIRAQSIVNLDGPDGDLSSAKRNNVLTSKLTSVLSSSYADSEIRDALRVFDGRYGRDELDSEFDLKYETQREVIEANARIIKDFSEVAKVIATWFTRLLQH